MSKNGYRDVFQEAREVFQEAKKGFQYAQIVFQYAKREIEERARINLKKEFHKSVKVLDDNKGEKCKFCGGKFRSREYYTETHYKNKQKAFYFTNSAIGVKFRFCNKVHQKLFQKFLKVLPQVFKIFHYEREEVL